MKTKKISLFFYFLWVISIHAQTVAPKDRKIQIPSIISLQVEKVLYQFASTPHFMGDGHRAYIAKIAPEEMTNLIKNNISLDKQWNKGSIKDSKFYLSIFVFIERWMDVAENKDDFNKVFNLSELKSLKNVYFKADYKKKTSGYFSDATLWIIIPSNNLIVMLNVNT